MPETLTASRLELIALPVENLDGPGDSQISYTRGNSLFTESGWAVEPEVFFVDQIDVPVSYQGVGIGTEMFKDAIDLARREGFPLIRMGIIEPKVIKMVEKQLREGSIKDAAYVVPDTHELVPQMATDDVLTSDERIDPSRATTFLGEEASRRRAAIAIGEDESPYTRGVICAIALN